MNKYLSVAPYYDDATVEKKMQLHWKNKFIKVSTNSVRYRSENSSVGINKIIL